MVDADRRDEQRSDLRRIYDKLDTIDDRVSSVDKALGVHLARYEAIEEKVRRHEERWEQVEGLKSRGLGYAILAFLAAGGLGGTVAHMARKFLE